MKREHNDMKYIPFSEDLVFYAPLTEGDLTDRISGVSPTTDSGCSVEWDSERGMYLLRVIGYLKSALKYECLVDELTINSDITLSIDVEEYSINSIYNMIFGIPPYEYSQHPYYYYLAYIRHDRYYSSTYNRLNGKLVLTIKNNICNFYLNDTLITTMDWSAYNIRVDIGSVRINETASNVYSNSLYAKDARIYNRALTAEEVAQL